MFSFLARKMGCSFSTARISLLLFGFWSLCFLICAQIFFVASVLGSGSAPTILARSSEGRIGFINALVFNALVFALALVVLLAIFLLREDYNHFGHVLALAYRHSSECAGVLACSECCSPLSALCWLRRNRKTRPGGSVKWQPVLRSGSLLRLFVRCLGMFFFDVVRNFGTHLL